MLIQILVDNIKSYIIPYAQLLCKELKDEYNFETTLIHDQNQVVKGNILFLLSCQGIFRHLELNEYNLVVHASDLPQGRGWSPMSWQIVEGKNEIILTLFEAVEKVDAGKIYLKEKVVFDGTELLDELQHKMSLQIMNLIKKFCTTYPNIEGYPQTGESSYYPRRQKEDSCLDIHKTIDEQFNNLRICDNEQYPAFFHKNGIKYTLKIYKA
ncbi:MAG: methionyl-tRNA formyltransferase [Opitutaceae bacterium]|nr:methionyl-tRNA formyltransferase [Cytophagales bacterium]